MLNKNLLFVIVSIVCPSSIAITLSNGFTFDETSFVSLAPRATNIQNQKCQWQLIGCIDDCTTELQCDGNYNVIGSRNCPSDAPYCLKGLDPDYTCTNAFPMSNPTCLTKALDNFMCTADGKYPDPTDCTKYHICSGSNHTIVECKANQKFWYDFQFDDPYTNPGNGDFDCRFMKPYDACYCDTFACEPNKYVFRNSDRFHYAYCLEMGTVKKTMIFKCPPGTAHDGVISATNSVDCLPINVV